ncbi:uncharacterized protein CTHT_0073080 [Thermochaetoides thermophila DSM 1495]|uniref:Uncharacterized protein n=1 Tax=Chaetomium thermophilum (strain DSM 1495 / CBS 144.50 / IMI 039719) TaxID=759272 RepID=G0SHR3_CHATD|nr:hypothetical protein CTHT_0073080 [Thermochaetoides thermophila DSM 1495]EGS16983.1 hypothetical protein CTHT_0073080 [Thermochaetoides thermophila DSM 1495]
MVSISSKWPNLPKTPQKPNNPILQSPHPSHLQYFDVSGDPICCFSYANRVIAMNDIRSAQLTGSCAFWGTVYGLKVRSRNFAAGIGMTLKTMIDELS